MNETIEQKALNYFSTGYVCSEAVLKAVAETYEIDSPFIPAILQALGVEWLKRNMAYVVRLMEA